jgi:hypothetical protein
MESAVHKNGLSEDEVASALELLPQEQHQEALLTNFECMWPNELERES